MLIIIVGHYANIMNLDERYKQKNYFKEINSIYDF
jgi:hypothetical protein